jgi:two-component system KDP operon response regulator KdpE
MTEPAPVVLVIDDEIQIRRFLRAGLELDGFVVHEAETGAEAMRAVTLTPPDLVILDLGLPDMDGADVLERLRAWSNVPLIVLSVRSNEAEKVRLLENGADDYVVKPFSPREVVARVKALLRRANPNAEQESAGLYERGRLRIDFGTYQVFVEGKRRELALREFELLKFFVQHPMRVYTREQLLDMVWGRDTFVEPRTVDVHVRRLRQHIERDDANPELILTVRSVGYRFNPEALG